ncbi:MAG TPA: sigma factor-like helix-turn-helix DNA-binding protein [Acidimicrobiales bacterium]|nr:sigma factor-like helix-turn-helix DNA-binding protein [Acidimicrobiales bacterium]
MSDAVADPHPGFEAFYAEEHGRLVTTLLLATGDAEVARDATDEAFVRALQAWRRVQHMDSPAGWTYRVALNVVRRRARRAALERRLLAGRARPVATAVPAPAGEAWALVRDLPERQRTAVVLRFVADLTEAEVARAMGVSRSTVSSTLADAQRALGRALADDPEPSGGLRG